MNVGIVAAGPVHDIPDLKKVNHIDYWIGVDEGANVLYESGIQADLLTGDFDSIEPNRLESIKQNTKAINQFSSIKDETDLELAFLEAIKLKPTTVYIYGATGGRLDHAWVNVQLLTMFAEKHLDAWMVNSQNEMTVKYPGKYELNKDLSYPYISFLPLSEVVNGLTLQGFRYTLEDQDINQGSSLTISNEWSEKKGTYFFNSGILLVIKSRD
ncbi:thiamine diphosphokinase [Aquisalibacillus elongatus]|uniref:Thiamine diphosphokinase n=1 Tax=Aquisalibacillus elongatus TaxID=485577 RepID=A0A3N5C1S5_9BACI|nr:thiamine diphosphokinase [Aquisalibacillus elongatus]RPF56038.1 thiamine diphosphokinase [Aquisalibacillus elongatus]